jgi:hypothetical protein
MRRFESQAAATQRYLPNANGRGSSAKRNSPGSRGVLHLTATSQLYGPKPTGRKVDHLQAGNLIRWEGGDWCVWKVLHIGCNRSVKYALYSISKNTHLYICIYIYIYSHKRVFNVSIYHNIYIYIYIYSSSEVCLNAAVTTAAMQTSVDAFLRCAKHSLLVRVHRRAELALSRCSPRQREAIRKKMATWSLSCADRLGSRGSCRG